jgi:hypothetical protein
MNSRGEPVAGGFVFLYEPGTTTFITSYFGADLVTPHQNPVRLSGSGRADIWITLDCDMLITDRNGNTVLTQDNANPDSLGGDTSSLVPNGSFEVVTTPPVPDGWTALNDAGSTNAVDNTESTDGANSYRFTSAGSGGGSLTTTDFFPVNAVDQLRVNFNLFSDVAAVRNIVRIEWYDVTFTPISNSDVYDSTANPPAWTEFQLIATPPALARFAKCKLIGIDPSVLLAGNTYFDQISVFYPTVVSGIFDNITIQDNEIISTNLNGEISLKPNGLGPVNIFSTGVVDLVDVQNPLNISNLLDPSVSPHIAFDANQIQAKGDATTAMVLALNPLGGATSLGGGGFSRLVAQAGGVVQLRSDANTDAEMRRINYAHQDGTIRGWAGYTSGDTLDFRNDIDGGDVRLRASDAGGNVRSVIQGDPDGDVNIYHPGSDAIGARTADPAAGGLLANNTLTGAGLERVLTTPGDAGVLLPVGTTTNASLRWDGAAWVEETSFLITSSGEVRINDIRAIDATQIDILGLTEADPGMVFRDGAGISFEDIVQSGNPIFLNNKGVGTPTLALSGAGGGSLRLLNITLQIRNAGDTLGTTFSYIDPVLNVLGGTTIKFGQSLMLSQANSPPAGQSSNNVLYQKNTQDDSDIQPYIVPGIGGDEHALAYVNTKQFGNTNYNLNTAQNAERAVNGTWYYDDGGNWTITLEPSAQLRFPIGGSFTVLNAGSGTITIAEGTGDTLFYMEVGTGGVDTLGGATMEPGAFATIYRESATNWFIMGAGVTP